MADEAREVRVFLGGTVMSISSQVKVKMVLQRCNNLKVMAIVNITHCTLLTFHQSNNNNSHLSDFCDAGESLWFVLNTEWESYLAGLPKVSIEPNLRILEPISLKNLSTIQLKLFIQKYCNPESFQFGPIFRMRCPIPLHKREEEDITPLCGSYESLQRPLERREVYSIFHGRVDTPKDSSEFSPEMQKELDTLYAAATAEIRKKCVRKIQMRLIENVRLQNVVDGAEVKSWNRRGANNIYPDIDTSSKTDTDNGTSADAGTNNGKMVFEARQKIGFKSTSIPKSQEIDTRALLKAEIGFDTEHELRLLNDDLNCNIQQVFDRGVTDQGNLELIWNCGRKQEVKEDRKKKFENEETEVEVHQVQNGTKELQAPQNYHFESRQIYGLFPCQYKCLQNEEFQYH